MNDLAAIAGKALIDRTVMIQLLSMLEPTKLTEKSTVYHIGYERAKADLLEVFARTLGPEAGVSHSVKLIRELRRERGS